MTGRSVGQIDTLLNRATINPLLQRTTYAYDADGEPEEGE
jgi:hypothetical protein